MEQLAPDFEVRLFGNLEVAVGGSSLGKTRTKKERALFALLALRNGAPTDREWLARTLWPESRLDQARANLRRSLCDLGRALGPFGERLSSRAGEVCFDFSNAQIDAVEFDEAVTHRNPHSLRRAIQLHREPLLNTFEEEWARRERTKRFEAYLSSVEVLVLWTDPREGSSLLESALQQDPTNERILRKLVEILCEAGSPTAAIQAYNAWAERLEQEFGGRPSPETVNLVGGIRSRPQTQTAGSKPPIVPEYATKFFGRAAEIVQLTLALKEASGAVLTGLPGVGKTRLAVELARGVSPEFLDGVFFVESGRSTLEGLIERCAAALELAGPSTPESLSAFLRRRNALLVIDNVDSELLRIAEFLGMVTGSFARSRVVVTSRRPMNLPGAMLFHVSPLEPAPVAAGEFSTAAQLFANRARLVRQDFVLDGRNSASVEAVCRTLDGIPLAIEVAAAWIESLPLSTIDSRLGVRLARETVAFDPHSQRDKSLIAAFEECLDQLGANELRLLQAVSPFEDGWTLTAAISVCELPETELAKSVAGLVHKSLVTLQHGSDRYRMLDTTREIVMAGLGETEKLDRVRNFAHYCRDLVLALDSVPDRYYEDIADDHMLQERRNLEVALDWWRSEDPDLAVRLQFLLFHWRILQMEGIEWIERLLSGEKPPSGLEPMVYSCVGFSAFWARHRGAFELLTQAVSSAVKTNQPQWEAHAQNALSLHYQRHGQYGLAVEAETAGAAAARRANMPFFAELTMASLRYLQWRQGALGSVTDLARQFQRGEATGNWRAQYAALRSLCAISMEIDDLEQAAAYAAQLLPLTRRYCRHELANVLLWSVEIDRKLGNPKNVHRWLDEVIEVSRERRSPDREAAALQELSRLAEGRGDLEGAEAYLMRACRIFESRDSSRPLVDLLVRRAELALVANLPGKAHNLLDLALGIAEAEQVEWRHQDLARIEKLQAALQNRTAGAE